MTKNPIEKSDQILNIIEDLHRLRRSILDEWAVENCPHKVGDILPAKMGVLGIEKFPGQRMKVEDIAYCEHNTGNGIVHGWNVLCMFLDKNLRKTKCGTNLVGISKIKYK